MQDANPVNTTYGPIAFILQDLDGNRIDVSDWAISASFSRADVPTKYVDIAEGSGVTVTDGPNGVFEIKLTAAQTADLGAGPINVVFYYTDTNGDRRDFAIGADEFIPERGR